MATNRPLFFLFLFFILSHTNFSLAASTSAENNTDFSSEFDQDEDEDFAFFEENTTSEIYDPFEKVNRKVHVFNDYFDRYFLEHVAVFYHNEVPDVARKGMHNFLTNLSLPMSSLNSFLQGKVHNGLATFSHFLINSTLGIGGLFNIAGTKNITYTPEDLGQTFGYYGLGPGPYLVIPFLGPSSTRDFSGFVIDSAIDPLRFNLLAVGRSRDVVNDEIRLSITAMNGLDRREALIDVIKDIRKDSFDPYATLRSAYLQQRKSNINF